ncbi:MAG: diaminopimelate decarboxylase [Chloroflexota bacterium]
MERLSLFPHNTEVNSRGHLVIGGCDCVNLVAEFGTPLYLFDESSLREKCREFKTEFGSRYPETLVIYACKAYINRALAGVFKEEGLGLDVVSGGEIGIAALADFPMDRLYFHGNNKAEEELRLALERQVGRVVVDNFQELRLLNGVALGLGERQDILLRLTPGIDPHTHRYIATGVIDSKFGFPMASAEEAVRQALALPGLNLVGLHFHVGSLIPDVEPYEKSIDIVLGFAAAMKRRHGFELRELGVGGGYPVQYTLDSPVKPVADYAGAISARVIKDSRELGLDLPKLVVEPGRAIVGQAGVALYQVGAVKDIPGVRRYVAVDGGMADNIRPAIYGSRYEALLANRAGEANIETVTIAGKFCESGDILIRDIELPPVSPGDIVAIPDSGAYCLAMASNYNSSFKPPIVLLKEGKARLIRRRETLEDLVRCDLS